MCGFCKFWHDEIRVFLGKMMCFCPLCGNLMFVQTEAAGQLVIVCRICPIFLPITKPLIGARDYYKMKELDDILGGEEAWKSVDSTAQCCPKCNHDKAYFMQVQIRSADEPMTTFYRCCNYDCSHTWRED